MKAKSRFLFFVAALMLLMAIVFPKPVNAADNMKLSEKKIVMVKGATAKLTVQNCKKKVSWKSSKPSVATVSKSGKIKAKKIGTTKITAKVGKKTFTCKVKVCKKGLQYADMDLHWKDNGVECTYNIIQKSGGFWFGSIVYRDVVGKPTFTPRGIKIGSSFDDVKRAYGKKSLKKYNKSADKIYIYHINNGAVNDRTVNDETIPYDGSKELPVFEQYTKYYVEYAYKYGWSTYYLRFYFDSNKKVVAVALLSSSYH